MEISDVNTHGIKDVFGTPIRVGDRILKSRVGKFGGTRGWYLVVGFGKKPDGYHTLLTRKIYGFNRPSVSTKQHNKMGAVKQGFHRSYNKAVNKTKIPNKPNLHISRVIGEHTSHYGYYVDHEWRKNHAQSGGRLGDRWTTPHLY